MRAGNWLRRLIGPPSVLAMAACGGGGETHHLPPELVAMTDETPAIYDDGEMQLYEVRMPYELPITRPTPAQRRALSRNGGGGGVFPHDPWVRVHDLSVQVTWLLVNLDRTTHNVEILIDPYNEFGRYYPGLTIVDAQDGEALPNLSGIDIRRELPGLEDARGRSSRLSGTFTFADMEELAIDFATVINIIDNVAPPADPGEGDPRIEFVNHTFHVDNRQGDTPLTDRYRPDRLPALTGFDFGVRTTQRANIALEIAVELVDETGEYVPDEDSDEPRMRAPEQYYTLGSR